jgi:hypothetical protein
MTTKSRRIYLLFRAFNGMVFILIGIAFPIYIYCTYGFSYGPVYDHGSHVIGKVRYIWVGLLLGCMFVAGGAIQYKLAKFRLDNDR